MPLCSFSERETKFLISENYRKSFFIKLRFGRRRGEKGRQKNERGGKFEDDDEREGRVKIRGVKCGSMTSVGQTQKNNTMRSLQEEGLHVFPYDREKKKEEVQEEREMREKLGKREKKEARKNYIVDGIWSWQKLVAKL